MQLGSGHPTDCLCCAKPQATQEGLEELEFLRSACTAAQRGQVQRLKQILDRRPECVHTDGTAAGITGYTPLHYAARGGCLDAVHLLLQYGADVNRQTAAGGATPLHRAAYMGHTKVVDVLLKAGANGCIQDADGQTPLHKAVCQGHAEAARRIVGWHPIAVGISDRHGQTPADLAGSAEFKTQCSL